MTRPAGRQDLRARVWEILRSERSPASQVDIALRMLAFLERADLGDAQAEQEIRRVLDEYAVDDHGCLTVAYPPTADEIAALNSEAPKEIT